jgi:hypothetical protein
MPLHLLVPSLLRVNAPSSTVHQHPLRTLLIPLLLTPRAATRKYHVELPEILVQGCGAGEIEESMMWFALGYEKVGEDVGDDEKWRAQWLERLERRE